MLLWKYINATYLYHGRPADFPYNINHHKIQQASLVNQGISSRPFRYCSAALTGYHLNRARFDFLVDRPGVEGDIGSWSEKLALCALRSGVDGISTSGSIEETSCASFSVAVLAPGSSLKDSSSGWLSGMTRGSSSSMCA